jgi:hypothetical protein
VPPITDVRDISRIGYGFMASRALFAALDADVFGRLANGPKTLDARDVGWPADNDVVLMSYLLSAVSETAARGAGFGQCDVTPVVPGTARLLSARR